jgi:dTDP-4-dehydrorhamnose 3,5-epimerase
MNQPPAELWASGSGLPEGVVIHPLTPHQDPRGMLVEIFRESWDLGCRPVQWNALTSAAGVLRGVHVHVRHVDHLVLAVGRILLGLHDLRPWSPTSGASQLIELDASVPRAVIVPVGVAHGLYSPEPSLLVYGASHYWDPNDELGCRWNSEELRLAWPATTPTLSERDATAGDYPDLLEAFLRTWSIVHGSPPDRSGR